MGRKLLRILRHAVTMVRRNLHSYSMLSVTIVISFSLLLGFLTLMDSNHYSDYKEIFSQDRHFVYLSHVDSHAKAELMQEKASELSLTYSTFILETNMFVMTDRLALESGEKLANNIEIDILSVPRQAWFLARKWPEVEELQITWLDDKDHSNFDLQSGEILMDEQLYYALGLDEIDRTVDLDLRSNESRRVVQSDGTQYLTNAVSGTFTVVGTIASDWDWSVEIKNNEQRNESVANIINNKTNQAYRDPVLVFSLEDINPANMPELSWLRRMIFYADDPEMLVEMINAIDSSLYVHAIYESQNKALEKIQTEKGTKALVAMILLLLLGINLYSSFDNALNNRKFEIGVKRALGASAFSIVRQFFYEGLLVMIVDILLSVAIVTDVAIAYKFIKESIPDEFGNFEHYVLYISPYSVAIFIICAMVLTVVFSFVFAYKSTQVQIVDYLKAE